MDMIRNVDEDHPQYRPSAERIATVVFELAQSARYPSTPERAVELMAKVMMRDHRAVTELLAKALDDARGV